MWLDGSWVRSVGLQATVKFAPVSDDTRNKSRDKIVVGSEGDDPGRGIKPFPVTSIAMGRSPPALHWLPGEGA